ncbi:MAG: tetratricopeptide repeat protein [Myxococcota bacterium]
MNARSMMAAGWVAAMSVLLAGAGFDDFKSVDAAKASEALVLKLSTDINKVDHSIEVTKELIKNSPDAPYLADLYYRLAELHVERSRYVFARLMELRPEGSESSLAGEKALEVQISKRLAIETYDKILTEYPNYDKNDEIMFFKGHEYRELGEFDEMLKDYETLISKYPKSPWAIEARLIIGDHHFDKSEFDAAEAKYQGILDLPESHLHDMARYKLAWIRINQERFADSLKLFELAVKSKRKDRRGAVGDAHSLDVKREALTAMVWPFSEVRKAHEAPEYFRKLADSKTLYVEVLKKLANRYFVKTEYGSAALLYREVVRLSANLGENVEYIQRIYESIRSMSAKNPKRYANAAIDVRAMVDNAARFQNDYRYSDERRRSCSRTLRSERGT